MKKTSLEKRSPTALKDKAQYAFAFGVIALMLYVVGFPVVILAFFGALTFFVWKAITGGLRLESRPIFEFYLLANEILRDDGRRWYGFEIKDTIERGEGIVRSMLTAPPLVHFALGALYQSIDDHTLAIKHLAESVEVSTSDETGIVFPTPELRDYVRLLRKIERSPAESPQTSAAIRSLERMRKNRGQKMLDHSRANAAGARVRQLDAAGDEPDNLVKASVTAVSAVEPVDDDTRFRTGSRSDRIPSRVVSFMQPDERDPA
ncbi:MAG: hypothetical protein KBD94_10355, partial [Pyrinomonadaceae bacterium]|nr:hypothetical protein [Pyrinomonadaceae bacterium]